MYAYVGRVCVSVRAQWLIDGGAVWVVLSEVGGFVGGWAQWCCASAPSAC